MLLSASGFFFLDSFCEGKQQFFLFSFLSFCFYFLVLYQIPLDLPGSQGIPKGMETPVPANTLQMVQGERARQGRGGRNFSMVRKAAPGPQIKAAQTGEEACPAG